MRIVLVEDDSTQAGLISDVLRSEFPTYQIDSIATESDFLASVEGFAADPPALIVMDVMLRWCDVSENMPPIPEDYQGFGRAGVRCCDALRQNPGTRSIPVIVLTVLDKNGLGLPEGCIHVPKTSDFRDLVDAAESRLKPRLAVGP